MLPHTAAAHDAAMKLKNGLSDWLATNATYCMQHSHFSPPSPFPGRVEKSHRHPGQVAQNRIRRLPIACSKIAEASVEGAAVVPE